MKDFFHIHTYRCGHTDGSSDEDYIKRAIGLGGTSIWFTDHAPFPGNPFGNRMNYEDLEDYISSLQYLREKYTNIIDVKVGLEIEYFPSYDYYYNELASMDVFDCLLLGQHMYELEPNNYSFSLAKERLQEEECYGLFNAIKLGIESGYFNILAHPDRIFRRIAKWDDAMDGLVDNLINVCFKNNITLEKNIASQRDSKYYDMFWRKSSNYLNTIIGYDAHSTSELK